jgi:hypothetical protein
MKNKKKRGWVVLLSASLSNQVSSTGKNSLKSDARRNGVFGGVVLKFLVYEKDARGFDVEPALDRAAATAGKLVV